MPSADALDALGRALAANETQLTIAQIDWTALKAVYQTRRRRPMLEQVANRPAPVRTAQAAEPAENSLATLATLPESERKRRLVDLVQTEAATVLALRPHEVDSQLGLFEMGMDSLMSVELRARLERRLSRKLPSTLTFNYPNVQALAGYIDGIVASQSIASTPAVASPVTSSVAPATPAPSSAESPSLADDRSEDEIAALLSDALNSLD
jgi:acyl carrier protein